MKVYFTRTRKERDCDTVEFFPHDIPFPSVSLKDHLHQAADDIVNLLTEPPSSTVPSLKAGDPTRNAILELAQLLKRAQKIPEHIQEINPSTIQSPPRVQMKEKETSTNSSISPRVHNIPYDEDEIDTPSTKRTPNTPIIHAKTL